MEMTDAQAAQMMAFDRMTQIVCALIDKRVTAASVLTGTTKANAAQIVADAKLIVAEMAK